MWQHVTSLLSIIVDVSVADFNAPTNENVSSPCFLRSFVTWQILCSTGTNAFQQQSPVNSSGSSTTVSKYYGILSPVSRAFSVSLFSTPIHSTSRRRVVTPSHLSQDLEERWMTHADAIDCRQLVGVPFARLFVMISCICSQKFGRTHCRYIW